MTTVLVVDDEPNLLDLLRAYLEREGWRVLGAADGPGGLEAAARARPDVIVLDVLLPGLDGIEFCRGLREFSDAYVLMLTARAEELDKLVGLAVGADDYLTKPFSPREVVARIQAMLRRPRGGASPSPAPLRIGDLVLDLQGHQVRRGGVPVALTAREFDLLAALAERPGAVLTRRQLLDRVWGDPHFDPHVVDVHVANLRRKLEAVPAGEAPIRTVRGVGYCLAAGPG